DKKDVLKNAKEIKEEKSKSENSESGADIWERVKERISDLMPKEIQPELPSLPELPSATSDVAQPENTEVKTMEENTTEETPSLEITPSLENLETPLLDQGGEGGGNSSPVEPEPVAEPEPTPAQEPEPEPEPPAEEPPVESPPENPVSFFFPKKVLAQNITGPIITKVEVFDINENISGISALVENEIINGMEIQKVRIPKPEREFRPGKYTLKITLVTENVVIESQQDFTWGVLVVNMDKSIYTSGDNAYLQIGVIDDFGKTICNADLDMEINSPTGSVYNFNTSDNSIVPDEQCGPNNVINVPDYYAHFFNTNESGEYKIKLTAITENGTRTIIDKFKVEQAPLFSVERTTASRIYPVANYPVTLKVKAKNNFSGIIKEKVPITFEILPPQNSIAYDNVEEVGQEKIISWNISMQAGEEKILGYYYDAPNISPELFLLGPLTFTSPQPSPYQGEGEIIFQEIRKWQIASDAVCGSNATGNWSDGTKWTGCSGAGGKPGAGDDITINAGHTITMDEASANLGTITIAGTGILNTSNGTSWNLTGTTITVAGTLTANASTITLNGTSGTLFTRSGTFTAGTSNVVITSNGASTPTLLSAATTFYDLTINAPTATVINQGAFVPTISRNLTITAGVFNSAGAAITGNASGTFSIASGATLCYGGATAATNATCDSAATDATARTWPTFASYSFNSNSNQIFLTNAALTLPSVTYGNLTFRPIMTAARVYTLPNGFTVAGTFTSTPTTGTAANRILTMNVGTGTNAITGAVTLTGRVNGANVSSSTFAVAANTITFSSTLAIESVTVASVISCSTGTISASNITLAGTFTNTDACTINLTGTSGTLFTRTGTFTQSTSTVRMIPDANVTLTSGTFTFYNLDLLPTIDTTNRTYTFGAGAITIASAGRFTINPSALSTSSTAVLEVDMGAGITVNATSTTTVTATQSGGSTISSVLDTTTGNLALSTGYLSIGTTGTFKANGSTITLTGTTAAANLITFPSGATFTAGTSTVSITGVTNSNVINSAAMTGSNKLNNLQINSTGITKSLGANLEVGGTTTITLGVLAVTTNTLTTGYVSIANSASATLIATSGTINLTGTTGTLFTRGASGVFTRGTSTVAVISTAGPVTLLSAATTFNKLTINPTAGVQVNAGAVITLDGVSSSALNVTTGTLDDSGSQMVFSANTSCSVTISNGATIEFGSAGTATTVPTVCTTFSFGATSNTVYQSGVAQNVGRASLTLTYGNLSFTPLSGTPTFRMLATANVNGNLTVTTGTLDDQAFQITGNASGTFTLGSGATFCLSSGATACTTSSTTSTTMPTFLVYSFTNTSTVTYVANNAQAVSSTPTYGNLKLAPVQTVSGKTYTLGATQLNVASDFDINPPSGAFLLTVNMGADVVVSGTTYIRGTTATSKLDTLPGASNWNLTTAYLNIGTQGTLDCTSSSSTITLTGTSAVTPLFT
ncbi:hypothetical protein M0R04_16315, partial [Candidatus Dojkabacteria bacterium]|nr:hypothetical protein [Candidatus Dojkabacteria bacterium]